MGKVGKWSETNFGRKGGEMLEYKEKLIWNSKEPTS
jgi:hypothetical protein